MAGLTLDQAQAKLTGWMAADDALQKGQSYRFNERLLTKADALEVRNNIDYWDRKCKELEQKLNGQGRIRTASPTW